jgi:hypothetical protein
LNENLRRLHLPVLFLLLLFTLGATWPLAVEFGTAIPGDSFDGWQNYWNLWWVKTALVEKLTNPYLTDLLFAPTGVGLYFHTLNPFNGLVTLPIQVSAGLFPAYNSVVVLSWVLSGYGAFLLVRWLLLRYELAEGPAGWWAPLLAGVIFTFSPFHFAHLLGHMQVFSFQWIPFYVLALLQAQERAATGRRWLPAALRAGLFLILAGLCDWYFVLYLFFFTGLAILWQSGAVLLKRQGWQALRAPLLPALAAGGLFALTLSPLLWPMVQEARQFRFMVRPAQDFYLYSATLLDFLIPNRLHVLARPDSFGWPGNQVAPISERTLAIGYVALAGLLAAAIRLRGKVLFWLLTTLFFLLLALGPNPQLSMIREEDIPPASVTEVSTDSLFGLLNATIPFMNISRSVSRYALMVQLCVAVLAALGMAAGLQRLPNGQMPKAARLVPLLWLAVVAFEYKVDPYPMSPPDTPAWYSQLALDPDPRAVLNLPMNYDRPGYLLYQTVHHKPLTVAYISREDPRTLTERLPLLQHLRHLGPDIIDGEPTDAGATQLADLGAGWVVLDRYKMPGGAERDYTEAVAAALFAGQSPVFSDERITVYRVEPPVAGQQPQPYLSLGPLNWGALAAVEDERARALLGPVTVALQHAPPTASLRISYRTSSVGRLLITAPDGSGIEAAPAPEGATVSAPATRSGQVLSWSLAPAAGEVWITGLAWEAGE